MDPNTRKTRVIWCAVGARRCLIKSGRNFNIVFRHHRKDYFGKKNTQATKVASSLRLKERIHWVHVT